MFRKLECRKITSEKKMMKWDVKNYIIHILKSFGFHVSCRGCILVILLEHQWVEGSFVKKITQPTWILLFLGCKWKKSLKSIHLKQNREKNAWIFGSILSINGYLHLWHWNWIVFSARPRHLTAMVSCPSFSCTTRGGPGHKRTKECCMRLPLGLNVFYW